MACVEMLLNRADSILLDNFVNAVLPFGHSQSSHPKVHFPLLDFDSPKPTEPSCTVPPPVPAARRHRKVKSEVPSPVDYVVNPVALGFVPAGHWLPGEVWLSDVTAEFIRARSSRLLRFEHKLWNALALTKSDPALYASVGVMWLTPTVLKVNREVFGHFINVTRPAAALYNMQGSFATHGFHEVRLRDVQEIAHPDNLTDVDESIVRLFEHMTPLFNIYSTDAQVLCCRYVQSSW
jgi:hypothetical protein